MDYLLTGANPLAAQLLGMGYEQDLKPPLSQSNAFEQFRESHNRQQSIQPGVSSATAVNLAASPQPSQGFKISQGQVGYIIALVLYLILLIVCCDTSMKLSSIQQNMFTLSLRQ